MIFRYVVGFLAISVPHYTYINTQDRFISLKGLTTTEDRIPTQHNDASLLHIKNIRFQNQLLPEGLKST
jgi:hypothetical protein